MMTRREREMYAMMHSSKQPDRRGCIGCSMPLAFFVLLLPCDLFFLGKVLGWF